MGRRLTGACLVIHPIACDGEFELAIESTPPFVPGHSYLPPELLQLLNS